MKKDVAGYTQRNNDMPAQVSKTGNFKGIVVDNRDPFQTGRIRLWDYGTKGDYNNQNVDDLPWSEPMFAAASFTPPPLFARAWGSFEAGDMYAPVWTGSWHATPMGDGTLPHNKWVGSTVRPECWHNHDLYPEVIMSAYSGDGNAIWFEDKLLGASSDGSGSQTGDLVSSINIVDCGGKRLRLRSICTQVQGYSPITKVGSSDSTSSDDSTLYQKSFGEFKPTRKGTEFLDEMDAVSGSLDLQVQNNRRSMTTDEDEYATDSFVQLDEDSKVATDEINMAGLIARRSQARTAFTAMDDCMFLYAKENIFATSILTPPERWDDTSSNQQVA